MRQFTDSLTRTSVGMWILLFGNVFNICFNYLLIFGKFGAPRLGLEGAAIASVMAEAGSLLFFLLYTRYAVDGKVSVAQYHGIECRPSVNERIVHVLCSFVV